LLLINNILDLRPVVLVVKFMAT